MTPERFSELAEQGYNRIPLVREVQAGGQTLQLSAESVEGGEKWGRYSILDLPFQRRLQVRGHGVTLFDGNTVLAKNQQDDPLSYIETFQNRITVPEAKNLPLFNARHVADFGYGSPRLVERG